jgi:competence protein ComEC
MIGAPASAVRAGIMIFMALLAEKSGRMYLAPWALLIAALAILIFNPLLLLYDVGFQLSFLAVLGIIYLSPVFDFYLARFWFFKNKGVRKITSMTLGAQVFTLPILVYNFGTISLVAPVVNVLVVPLLPAVLVLGFLGILAGLFSQLLGMLVALPIFGLLSYVLEISSVFARLSFSSIQIQNLHWAWIIVFYAFLIWAVKRSRKMVVISNE